MGATDNFFDCKREWSQLKDEILATYLRPYLMKITTTRRPVLIVDCFAGKGRFDDGEPGSPQLICEAIEAVREARSTSDVRGLFIEKKYHKELEKNLSGFEQCEVLPGSFEEHIDSIGPKISTGTNVLLFVDPYGIKSLNMSRFRRLLEFPLGSLEVIMNFTSFGFLREGCRLLTIEGFDCEEDSDVYEAEPERSNPVERMNAIAGGTYWKDILSDFHNEKIDMRTAEQTFSQEYMEKLHVMFSHVVNIPVKYKRGHLPKYRLVYGTESPDGLILMADKMSRVWYEFVHRDRAGQEALFEEIDFPDSDGMNQYSLEDDILETVGTGIGLKDLLVRLIGKHGITYSLSRLSSTIKAMEQGEILELKRCPEKTAGGKMSKSMDYRKSITVRKA